MIGRLRGTLIESRGPLLVVDCGGVGYDVAVSTYTAAQLPAAGEDVTLRIYTQVLETRIALYGFLDVEERELFDLLITVKNVGPSTALAILSGSGGPRPLASLIADGQTNALTKLRGVGRKTAELLVVELRDKCQLLLATWGAASSPAARPSVAAPHRMQSARPPLIADVEVALTQLGYRAQEVERALTELGEPAEGDTLETLLRRALRGMPR